MRGNERIHEIAERYLTAGLSAIPIRPDGSKQAAVKWKEFQSQRMSQERILALFPDDVGVAIVCGAVSGGLEVLDFEDARTYSVFEDLIGHETPGLLPRLPCVRTPGGGVHVYFRSSTPSASTVLARSGDKTHGKDGLLLEVRGEGSYVLAPGCPKECHSAQKPYEHLEGPPITETPTLLDCERQVLLSTAKALDDQGHDASEPVAEDMVHPTTRQPGRAGDDFSLHGDFEGLLTKHGWGVVGSRGGVTYLRRPRKSEPRACSATLGYCRSRRTGAPLLRVFSTNAAPFEAGRAYSAFAAMALLEFSGDFSAAARHLASQGYGSNLGVVGAASGDEERTAAEKGPFGIQVKIRGTRRTPQRFSATIDVEVGSEMIPGLLISSGVQALQLATREVVALLPNEAQTQGNKSEISRFLRRVLRLADERDRAQPRGRSMLEIMTEEAKTLRFTFRSENERLWSETRQAFMYQRQFADAITNGRVLRALRTARDCDQDIRDTTLIQSCRHLADSVFADILTQAPLQPDADLGPASAAAEQLRSAVARVWTKSRTLHADNGHAMASTLAGEACMAVRRPRALRIQSREHEVNRVRDRGSCGADATGLTPQDALTTPAEATGPTHRATWRPVHSTFAAWVRENADGTVSLAMRHDLFLQMGEPLPSGVRNAEELLKVMERYVLGEAGRVGKSGRRVVVLSADMVAELSASVGDLGDCVETTYDDENLSDR